MRRAEVKEAVVLTPGMHNKTTFRAWAVSGRQLLDVHGHNLARLQPLPSVELHSEHRQPRKRNCCRK